MNSIQPFNICIPDSLLNDLQRRLHSTRWPDPEIVEDWSQGVPLAWIKDICHYWEHKYDWRAREVALNRFPQYITNIDGVDIHFVHVRSLHPCARPLLLTHGWPGSIVEFQKVLGRLADPTSDGASPDDAFHVICPSIPGFGFSGKPTVEGWGIDRFARTWIQLMERLGYSRYFAQGGDAGAGVTAAIGSLDVAHCAGIHLTLALGIKPQVIGVPTPEERRALDGLHRHRQSGSGYSRLQSSRPQTLGYALADSPVGQAAWILEKFYEWTDCNGDPENIASRDELLDNVMLYWVTNSAVSSARLYWEERRRPREIRPVPVPTGVAVFPKEITPPVRKWMESVFTDIRHWSEMPRGGHFAALEQPDLFVNDVRECFRELS